MLQKNIAKIDKVSRLLRSTAEALHVHVYRTDKNHRLSPSQFSVLEALLNRGPLNQRELAIHSNRTSGNMTVVVDNLQKRGLVSRCAVEDDRRVVQVCLTNAGREMIEQLFPNYSTSLSNAFSGFNDDDLIQLEKFCIRLNEGMLQDKNKTA